MALGKAVLDWLYPPSCLICGEAAEAHGALCALCWREMRWMDGAACPVCAAPLGLDIPGPPDAQFCPDCRRGAREWRLGAAVCLYEGAARKLVLALKHGDRLDAAKPMGAWMARAGRSLLSASAGAPPVLVAPTPLHWRRRAGRRFNQALELARAVAAFSDAQLAPDLLRKPRATPSQGGLDRAERRQNLANAFRLSPGAQKSVAGRSVVLIDDVLTTGSTLSACAEALKKGGASCVDALVFARAARDPEDAALASFERNAISKQSENGNAEGQSR